ncbi:pyridoxamine 5'-phosphate oxidase [Cumulibacter manganitolerans]|uniref:pyridoxamine 5'-phosphate oxidase n=1 Tax=Cumulibacter manganitolerans TaxID=1884992 RepID=UPI001885D4D1|nr:pyridoxamine 5'-phosphate oxidase [Cumulibacter manganitolerans]
MSVEVKLADLGTALEDFDVAYLLSVGGGRVKVVCVDVRVDGDVLVIPTASKGTLRNLEGNDAVTVLCPPREPRGLSLIVDGTAAPDGDGFVVRPASAILHRPATHADGPVGSASCDNDCRPVG